MSFNEAQILAAVNGVLEEELAIVDAVRPLKDAISYATFPGGKRIRPLFALALFYDIGGQAQDLIPAAVSLELMHCASLIHDDLPALDNDDMRRGKLSCHKAFGEATAILAADFMIPYAIHRLLKLPLPLDQCAELAETLSRTFLDLCNGQQLDMTGAADKQDLARMHRLKTGALFAAAARFAAIVAGLSPAIKEIASQLGLMVGVYFQIVDDYLDVFGGDEKGRAEGSDQRNKKATFFSGETAGSREALHAARQAVETAFSLLADALAALGQQPAFAATRAIIAAIDKKAP